MRSTISGMTWSTSTATWMLASLGAAFVITRPSNWMVRADRLSLPTASTTHAQLRSTLPRSPRYSGAPQRTQKPGSSLTAWRLADAALIADGGGAGADELPRVTQWPLAVSTYSLTSPAVWSDELVDEDDANRESSYPLPASPSLAMTEDGGTVYLSMPDDWPELELPMLLRLLLVAALLVDAAKAAAMDDGAAYGSRSLASCRWRSIGD